MIHGVRKTETAPLKHEELTERIIKVFYTVYNDLGHGFLESVYEESMAVCFRENGLNFTRQCAVPVWFHQQRVGEFRADFVIEKAVLLELKALQSLDAVHDAQLVNYLNATEFEVGLLLNFGPKPQIHRRMLDNDRKKAIARVKAASSSGA
jgi:GxxExxY protein